MAGHSKWANTQHRKGAQDNRRAKVFSKLIRELTVAARQGVDPAMNPRLRLAMDRARAQSMPRDTIERSIGRGSGGSDGAAYEQVTYEGYGPGGVAVIVEALTDNRNRTVADVRHAFLKYAGNLGAAGSVAYLFNPVGLISFEPGANETLIMDAAIELGAEDVVTGADGTVEVLTSPAAFFTVRAGLQAAGFSPALAEVTRRAAAGVRLTGTDAQTMVRFLAALEDLDDVQNVYSSAEIPDEVLATL